MWGHEGRRSQVTFWIILGIVAIILVLIVIQLPAPGITVSNFNNIKGYYDQCTHDKIIDSILLTGAQGGYTILPAKYNQDLDMGLYVTEEQYNVPSKEDLKNQLENWLSANLPKCERQFEGFNTIVGAAVADVTIGESKVIVKIDMPIDLTKEEETRQYREFVHEIPIRLGHIHKIASEISQDRVDDPLWVDFSALDALDVDVDLVSHDDKTLVYYLIDSKSMILGEPYVFAFVVGLRGNMAPVTSLKNSYLAQEGEKVQIPVNAMDPDGDTISYSSSNPYFAIGPTGMITFDATVAGVYETTLTVKDSRNAYVNRNVKVVVI